MYGQPESILRLKKQMEKNGGVNVDVEGEFKEEFLVKVLSAFKDTVKEASQHNQTVRLHLDISKDRFTLNMDTLRPY